MAAQSFDECVALAVMWRGSVAAPWRPPLSGNSGDAALIDVPQGDPVAGTVHADVGGSRSAHAVGAARVGRIRVAGASPEWKLPRFRCACLRSWRCTLKWMTKGSGMADLVVESVEQWYRRSGVILAGIDLTLGEGVAALLGQNGSGKTTLLKTLVGQLKPKAGTVRLGGVDLYSKEGERERTVRIGYLPQRVTFDSRLTVCEFIAYIAWMRGFSRSVVADGLDGVVASLGLEPIAKRRMGELSGGQVQRAGIGAAVIGRPDVLILDEPTAGLDPVQRLELRGLIGSGLARTTLLSTHMIDDVMHLSPRVVALTGARVAYDGDVAGLEARAPAVLEGMSRAEAGFAALVGQAQS